MIPLLGISGSLREGSTNTALLQALRLLAPERVHLTLFTGLATLPHFNADLDVDPPPDEILRFRQTLLASRAVLISTPEYAHGLPGSLKNALDWLVRSGELYEKPVALINASARAIFAQDSLREILTTMGARLLPQASVTIPLLGTNLRPEEIASNPAYSAPLRAALNALLSALPDR